MPSRVRYLQPGDDWPTPPPPFQIDDDSDGWLGGFYSPLLRAVAVSLAAVALSTQIAIAQVALPQEEIVPQPPPVTADEDFWQVTVLPPIPTVVPSPAWDDQIPAGSLFGQPDEDFWINPVAPVVGNNVVPRQWIYEQNEPAGSLFGQPDEDFGWWILYGPPRPLTGLPIVQALPQWQWDEQVPAGSLFGQPDEDFWSVQIVPWPKTIVPPAWWDDQIPAGSLYGQPDEDWWIPPLRAVQVPPVQAAIQLEEDFVVPPTVISTDEDFPWNLWLPKPITAVTTPSAIPQWQWDVQESAGALFGQPDEDFWLPPLRQVQKPPVQAVLQSEDDLPIIPPSIGVDEDYRWNLWLPQPVTAATVLSSLPQWQWDVQESAGSLFGESDEDFLWSQWLPKPVVGTPNAQSLPHWQWDIQEPAGTLFGQADEDFWIPPVRTVQAPPVRPFMQVEDEIPGPSLGITEEYLWSQWCPGPILGTASRDAIAQWRWDVQEPAGNLYTLVDDLAWFIPQPQVTSRQSRLISIDEDSVPPSAAEVLAIGRTRGVITDAMSKIVIDVTRTHGDTEQENIVEVDGTRTHADLDDPEIGV